MKSGIYDIRNIAEFPINGELSLLKSIVLVLATDILNTSSEKIF